MKALGDLVLLVLLGALVTYLVFTPYENTVIHRELYNRGISQRIEQFENR